MNKIQWIGIIGIACVILFMLAGCSWDIEWDQGKHTDPVVLYPVVAGTCGGPTTDWPCLEAEGCAIIG